MRRRHERASYSTGHTRATKTHPMQIDLKVLIGKLNGTCRQALEAAAGLCVSQTHYTVELEHFLLQLLDLPDTDMQRVLRAYEVEAAVVRRELTQAMERL